MCSNSAARPDLSRTESDLPEHKSSDSVLVLISAHFLSTILAVYDYANGSEPSSFPGRTKVSSKFSLCIRIWMIGGSAKIVYFHCYRNVWIYCHRAPNKFDHFPLPSGLRLCNLCEKWKLLLFSCIGLFSFFYVKTQHTHANQNIFHVLKPKFKIETKKVKNIFQRVQFWNLLSIWESIDSYLALLRFQFIWGKCVLDFDRTS